jgi:putative ABC transport system permease protein
MRQTGADLGDRLLLKPIGEDRAVAFAVVGRAMVTDGAEPNVGRGALVTPAGLDRIEPGGFDDAPLAISFAPGADRARTLAELKRLLPAATTPFPVPTSLLNAERVADLPLLLALGAAALAAVTFAHALLVSARRSRRELAICRVLGFTHGQVRTTLSTQALALAAAAALLGVPLGVIGARWGWRLLADAFGVAAQPLVPLSAALACITGVLMLAALTALPSAATTARRRTAEVLRSE